MARPSRAFAPRSRAAARRAAAGPSRAFGPGLAARRRRELARRADPGPHGRARLARRPGEDLVAGEARHLDVQVDAVEDRAREPRPVGLGAARRADAAAHRVAVEAAGAGVARAHEQGPRGKARADHRAGDVDAALLERLPQRVDRRRREGADLVEEEHPAVREAHLARPRDAPAAHEARGRDGVVRGAERAPRDQRTARVEQPGHRVDAGDLDRLVQGQRRQDAGQAAREHRLAGAGRARASASSGRRPRPPPAPAGRPPARAPRPGRGRAPPRRPPAGRAASGRTSAGSARPSSRSTAARSVAEPRTSTPGTSAASEAFPRGTTSRRQPRRAACSAIARAPGTGRSDPSRASSPTAPTPASAAGAIWPDAQRIASASGRSYCGPALRRSAGARLATMRRAGTWNAWLASPERTRSRASCTAASGRPTTEKAGRPARRSTSTSTVEVSRPRTAGLTSRATTRGRLPGAGARETPRARRCGDAKGADGRAEGRSA